MYQAHLFEHFKAVEAKWPGLGESPHAREAAWRKEEAEAIADEGRAANLPHPILVDGIPIGTEMTARSESAALGEAVAAERLSTKERAEAEVRGVGVVILYCHFLPLYGSSI
jgi:hypothetical protein